MFAGMKKFAKTNYPVQKNFTGKTHQDKYKACIS